MALTKAQWLVKLRSFVPPHLFEEEEFQIAHWSGIAAVLAQLQLDAENHIKESFIKKSAGDFVDAHGDERSLKRILNEIDSLFQERIRNLTNQSDCPAIKELVDKFLIKGEATIIEHWKDGPFLDEALPGRGGVFADRKQTFIDIVYNTFSIVVDRQIPDPETFGDRSLPGRDGAFADREEFAGTLVSSQTVFDLIVAAVNEIKAFGTLYRVIEVL